MLYNFYWNFASWTDLGIACVFSGFRSLKVTATSRGPVETLKLFADSSLVGVDLYGLSHPLIVNIPDTTQVYPPHY